MKTSALFKTLIGLLVLIHFNSGQLFAQTDDDDEKEICEASKGRKYGKTPEDSVKIVTNLSLYRENIKSYRKEKNKEYIEDAIAPWRYVFFHGPLASQNIYIDGIEIVKYMYDKETDAVKKQKYIDTLLMVYDQRIRYYCREGYNLGRKGVDMVKYRPEAAEENFNTLKKSFDLRGNKTESAVLYYYFIATINYVKAGKADTTLIIETYDKMSEVAEINMAKNNAKSAGYASALENIETAFAPFAKCEDLIKIYSKKFESSPNDVSLLKKITKILDKKNCTDSDLFFKATENLHKAEPTAETAFLMGKMNTKKSNFSAAAKYYEEAINLFPDSLVDKKADCYLLHCDALRNLNSFVAARNSALKAAALRPSDGRPYILIGDLYAASASSCGDNDLTKKVAYWAAVDKYIKAKSVDPKLEETANQKIEMYSRYFPAKTDIFFYNLSEGQSYTVGCWINETTTVRSAR